MKVVLKDKKSKQEKAYEVRKADGAEIPVLGYWERAWGGEGLKRFRGESEEQYFARVLASKSYKCFLGENNGRQVLNVVHGNKRLEFRVEDGAEVSDGYGGLVYSGYSYGKSNGKKVKVRLSNRISNKIEKPQRSFRNLWGFLINEPRVVYEDNSIVVADNGELLGKGLLEFGKSSEGELVSEGKHIDKQRLREIQKQGQDYSHPRKRGWIGLKRLAGLGATLFAVGWPVGTMGYTAADISLHKPQPIDTKRIELLQELIEARDSGDVSRIRGAVDKYEENNPPLFPVKHGGGNYSTVINSILNQQTFGRIIPIYDSILHRVKLPIKLPEQITVIRGEKRSNLLDTLFCADLYGYHSGNILNINEDNNNYITHSRTLLKEVGVAAYFNFSPVERGKIRKKVHFFVESLLEEKARYLQNKKEVDILSRELEIFFKKEPYFRGCSVDFNSILCFYNNSDISLPPIIRSKMGDYLELLGSLNKTSENPLIRLEKDKGLIFKRLTSSEVFSELFAKSLSFDIGIVNRKRIDTDEGMFGNEVFSSTYADFKLENKYPLSDYRIVDKSMGNFPYLWWLNFSSPVRNQIWRLGHRDVLREEREDLKMIRKMAREYGIEDRWEVKDYFNTMAWSLGLLALSGVAYSALRYEKRT